MNPSGRISDEEIWAEIIYLDPDLTDNAKTAGGANQEPSTRIAVILSVLVSLYLLGVKFWPAILRIVN